MKDLFPNTPMDIKKRFAIMASMAAILVSILAGMNQADLAEPHWLATRSFVRDMVSQAASPIERRQVATQLFIAKSERSRLENEIANKQVILSQNASLPDSVKSVIQEQIRSLTSDLAGADRVLTDLYNQKDSLDRKH